MHPFAAAGKRMSRRSAKYPCQRHERNEQRAVGNAGSYAVRHRRAVRGNGSGSYRRVPEPVIARHPRGAWERQRGETYTRFDAEPFYTAVVIGQGKSKNHWFLAVLLPTFAAVGKSGSLRRAKYPRARGRGTLSAGGPQARPPSLLIIPLAADKIHIVPPVCPTRCPIGREPRHFTASRRE